VVLIRSAQTAALSLVLLAGSSHAGGMPESSQLVPEIIVTGSRDEALRSFVEALAVTGPTGQLARWKHPVCPRVFGIESSQAERMVQRIVEVAQSVGLAGARAGCRPSTFILVTPEPDSLAAQLVARYPITLGRDGRTRLKRFVDSDRPARWLAVTDPCSEGCALPNSRLVESTTPTITTMVVIVDAGRLAGYSLNEVSDYLALVVLSNPPADGEPPSDSILSIFGAARPAGARYELTPYDREFLAALYRVQLNESARSQRRYIINRMKKGVAAGESRTGASGQ
jgi:hypothetical protein